MRLIKQYASLLLTIAAITIAVSFASYFVLNSLVNDKISNRLKNLSEQSSQFGSESNDYLSAFEDNLHYLATTYTQESEHGTLDESTELLIRNFLIHNKDLADTLFIRSGNIELFAYVDERETAQFELVEFIEIDNEIDSDDLDAKYDSRTNRFTLNRSEISFTAHLAIHRLLNKLLARHLETDGAQKFFFSTDLGAFGEGYLGISDEKNKDEILKVISQSHMSEEFYVGEVRGKTPNLLDGTMLAVYPIQIFDEKFSVIFSLTRASELEGIFNLFLLVILANVFLIVLVSFLFIRNLKKLNALSDELKSNQIKLIELVDQQKLLFEYSEDFTYRHDREGNYDYVSENVLKVLGYTPEEFMRSDNRKFTKNEINKKGLKNTDEIAKLGVERALFYLEMLNIQGEAKMLEIKEKPIFNEAGKPNGVIGIAKDVTEKFAADLKFRLIFENAADPYFLYDEDGILDCNKAAVDILGFDSKEKIIGKSLSEFSPEKQNDGRDSIFKAEEMDALAIEKGSHKFDWVHKKADESVFPVEVSLTPLHLNNKILMFTVWHDLTDRKRVEHVLIEGRKKAEDLAQQKQQFLSSMSHEIRTPLNAVVGISHLLIEENPKPEQMDKLRSLKYSAENLLSLVNDVLDHSKIESGKILFSHERFDLQDRLEGIKEVMNIKAVGKGLVLNLEIANNVPAYVSGDAVRLNQIIQNLVSNAIKFTEKGTVAIEVQNQGETEEHIELEFIISDTGIGIAKEKQGVIFESFVQADSTILNNYGGTGLGLSITRNLVELQGGTISVESEVGKGSTFKVRLHFGKSNQEEAENDNKAKNLTNLVGAKILLVEDNPINQKIANQFLNKWGASVSIANNGREGLELITKNKFDLVLMDIQMPELDGYETTKAIRGIDEEYYKNVPIICLTADAFTEVRDRVLESGMNDYVTKPINPTQFLKTIGKYYKSN